MALVYSLSNAPAGLVIDPNTGILTIDGAVPQGVYNVEIYVTDTDTNETTLCKVVPFSCEPGDDGTINCTECINQHLIDHPHIPKDEINECIDEKISTALVDWIPPEPQKDCCDKKVIRFSYCGRVFDMLDWNGDGIIDINITPQFFSYINEGPDNSDAVIAPEFNSQFQALPGLPLMKYAGPPGQFHGLEKITHISDGKQWIPLCCDGGSSSGDKCLLIAAGEISYPFQFNTEESIWQIGTSVVNFPGCGVSTANLCATGAAFVLRNNLQTTGAEKPSEMGLYVQENDLFLTSNTTIGCDGVLTDADNTNAGDIYALDFSAWLGNTGNIDPSTVQSMKLCFDVNGSPIDFGVGMFDLYGKIGVPGDSSFTWQPVISATGPAFTQNSDWVQVTGPGSYEIEFGFHPSVILNESNSIEPVIFGVTALETISNYRFKIVSTDREPCGLLNSDTDLANLLTENDVNEHSWFVDTDGSICAIMPEGLCEIYQPPVFSLGAGVSCCQVVNQSFPVLYDPLTDGWIVGNERIYFGGNGIFQTAAEMAAWMTDNDPLGNSWAATLNNDGNWDICALIDSSQKQEYKFLTYTGSSVFKCIIEGVQFPLNYSPGDGWVIDGVLRAYPAGSVWFSAADLATWMESVDPYNNDWAAYLNDATSNTFSICGSVDEDLCDNYSNLTYNESDEFCCQAENIAFPLSYDPDEDGWIINNQIVTFGGDGTFNDAAELLQFMESNDPNNYEWEVYQGINDSFSFCAWLPNGECDQYTGMVISGGNTYYCDINSLSFPYSYSPNIDGWEVNGNVIPFTGDGTFETPGEFAAWLSDNDPNGFSWTFQVTSITGAYDFCSFMPISSTSAYNGIGEANIHCNFINHTFPWEYNSGDGWLINGDILTYYEVDGLGTFGSTTQFAQWLTDNDPNGYTWFYNGSDSPGIETFCAVMPNSEQGQYQGFYDGSYKCLANNLQFPLSYNTVSGGWTIGGIFYPFDGDGTWANMQELLDWVNSNDVNGNAWVVDGDSICGYLPFGSPSYGNLDFDGSQSGLFSLCQSLNQTFPIEPNEQVYWLVNNKPIFINPEGESCVFDRANFAQWLTDNDPNGYTWYVNGQNFCAIMPPEVANQYSGFDTEPVGNTACQILAQSFPYDFEFASGWLINNYLIEYSSDTGTVFGTPQQMLDWLNSNDPNGYTWVISSTNNSQTVFCAEMPQSEEGMYQGFHEGQVVCITDVLSYPVSYGSQGGWSPGGTFCPFPMQEDDNGNLQGEWLNLKQLLDWVNQNDPNGNTWVNNNGRICGWVKVTDPAYPSLVF